MPAPPERDQSDSYSEDDELFRFLDCFHWVYPNLNDTFAYACADSERVYMDGESNQIALVTVWRKWGPAGIAAYVAKMRGTEPLQAVRTEKYEAAKAYLEGWEYEDD